MFLLIHTKVSSNHHPQYFQHNMFIVTKDYIIKRNHWNFFIFIY